MNPFLTRPLTVALLLAWAAALSSALGQSGNPPGDPNRPSTDQGPGDGPRFGGPPPFGGDDFRGGGPGFGGPRGMMQQKAKLVDQFDTDKDHRLNAAERKAALQSLAQQQGQRGGRRGGFGPGGRGRNATPTPGPKVSPADVKSYPNAALYDPNILRTFFLQFDDADWEKELAAFKYTDVEVPATLTVDGKTYPDVGVHFRGMSSFMMVGEGQKRSLALSLDFAHKKQEIGGYRNLHLLNSHEDPSFLRSILSYQIDREYLPAPKANLVRVVINGESWGVYVNVQHFNKDFTRDWFGTTKGARWKVPGSPGGRGSLAYLGDDPAQYKQIYEIKSKDDPKAWSDLIKLCKVLNDTPAEHLEQALSPLLNIDGALKFLALENALINNDGYWIRTSDYNIYQDVKGQFHVLPSDANETFSSPGGPGFGGGPGGPQGRGGGPGGFGPGMFLAPQLLAQADKDGDQKITKAEFSALAETWFDKLDSKKTGKVDQEQFAANLGELLGMGEGFGPPGGGMRGGGPGPRGPAGFLAPALFNAADKDKNGSLTRAELAATFGQWFTAWDSDKAGSLNEGKLRTGLNATLPRPDFAGGPGGRGGRGGRGPGGPWGGPRVDGVKLDPLIGANDPNKPLISKLLAVPSLRTRYLEYVRDVAEKWLDWNKLGPIAQEYAALIREDVPKDTRKLDSTEDFLQSLTGTKENGGVGGGTISLKSFAEQRRAYLLSLPEVKKVGL